MIRPLRHRPVLALGILLILAVTIGACDVGGPPPTPIDGHPTTLAGTSWMVAAIGGLQPGRGSQPTIAFDASTARGSGGCNQFGGSYRYDPVSGELRFDEMGMTAMACAEPERNAVETRFIQVLSQANLATIGPTGQLVLSGPAGRIDLDAVGPTVTD